MPKFDVLITETSVKSNKLRLVKKKVNMQIVWYMCCGVFTQDKCPLYT